MLKHGNCIHNLSHEEDHATQNLIIQSKYKINNTVNEQIGMIIILSYSQASIQQNEEDHAGEREAV